MKKLVLFGAFLLMLSVFTSCKKDRDCTCTSTDPFTGETTTEVETFENSSKSDAEDACDALNAIYLLLDGNCELD